MARVKALLRRIPFNQRQSSDQVIVIDEITIKPESRELWIENNAVALTPKEFDLFFLLAKNPSRAFSREELLERIWGADFYGDFRAVDQHIKNIREKLKKAGCPFNPIQTIWGHGYKLRGKKKTNE
ncbi:winged helix-turn-helix domain-containing protein [Aneurinibacillus tyrosinisolvens]|uniref:winged helix-turn-helix domain-containing protein n=1 Tax=Aneurinibacillus tyrosinisolvens TaxID=1443435 RepID=UPI0034E2D37C